MSEEYVHPAHLGSGAVVTDEDGVLVTEVSFDAWGHARQAANWTEAVPDETLVDLGVGFTGHKAELDASLIDMGGRIYDPVVARFMQADPLVVQPANGQSYNHYSYVFNRPLTFTDPSGYAGVWENGRYCAHGRPTSRLCGLMPRRPTRRPRNPPNRVVRGNEAQQGLAAVPAEQHNPEAPAVN